MPFGWEVKFVVLSHLNWWRLIKMALNISVSSESLFLPYYFRKILMWYVNLKFSHTSAEHKRGYVTELIKLWYYEALTPRLVYIYTETPARSPSEIDPLHWEVLLLVKFALLYAGLCSMEGNTKVNRGGVLSSQVIPSTY